MTLEAAIQSHVDGFQLDVSMRAAPGETVAVLGPNGAGKTSLLRALAGLLPLDRGRVVLNDEVLEDTSTRLRQPIEHRSIGIVFQDYLLFPHLSVRDNVAFGLRARGMARVAAGAKAGAWLERVGLSQYADRKPAALSGGQAQRVALARAMAVDPALLLLDEPMAALDASTRADLRRQLRQELSSFDGIRLLVTHDPVEALALADRLVVIEGGRILQEGTAAAVTEHPRSRYVADLVGVNLFRGRLRGNVIGLQAGGALTVADAGDGEVFAVVHPRTVALYRSRPDGTPRNLWQGRAVDVDLAGDRVRVRLSGLPSIVAEVTPAAVRELGLDRGDSVWISVKATEIVVYAA